MRQVFTIIVLAVFVLAWAGCTRKSANTEDANNANSATESPFGNITDSNAVLAEGNRLLDENQTELAIQAYKQAVKLNPDLAEAHFQLGIACALLEMQYEQSGTVDPDNPDARVKSRSQKAFEKAVETYKKWLAANRNDDTAHFNLGRTYYKLDKLEEAEKEFRQAVKIKPDDTEYETELGAILVKMAQYRDAIGPLKKAVDLDPANERAANLLEDAEAGRQRLDYVSPNKSANKSNSNMSANLNTNTNPGSNSNSNMAPKHPPTNTLPPNKTKKDAAVDKRPRLVRVKPN